MLRNITDTHAHYQDARFDEDRDEVLAGLPQKGVCRVINCGTDIPSSVESMRLAQRYDHVFFAAGVHPEDCAGPAENVDLTALRGLLTHEKCVAVGEIGLDYYWQEVPRDLQNRFFEAQLLLANDLDLPVIVHDREAHGDTLAALKAHSPRGVLHCYSGSRETMRELLKLGMYIGVGGAVTFKNAKKTVEIAKEVPLDRLLIETDCPYMAPTPFRGKRNDSSLLPYVLETVAGLRGISPQALADQTAENADRLFFSSRAHS